MRALYNKCGPDDREPRNPAEPADPAEISCARPLIRPFPPLLLAATRGEC